MGLVGRFGRFGCFLDTFGSCGIGIIYYFLCVARFVWFVLVFRGCNSGWLGIWWACDFWRFSGGLGVLPACGLILVWAGWGGWLGVLGVSWILAILVGLV